MPETKYPIYHRTGPGEVYHREGCGEIALYTTMEDAQQGDVLVASKFSRLDGTAFEPGNLIICGHCGYEIPRLHVEWIDYDNPLQSSTS